MSDIKKCYHKTEKALSTKNHKVLARIFKNPVVADLEWREVESLIMALGGNISEGNGSRKRVFLNGVRSVFHEPHPQKEIDKGAVKSLRRFLVNSGLLDADGTLLV